MSEITLPNSYENYSFEYIADRKLYKIRLCTFRDILYADVYMNNELLCAGVRCICNQWLITRGDMVLSGNFRFESSSQDYPTYDSLSKTCFLKYYSAEEIARL